jgi:neuroblastoma-amplified sequence
MTEFKIAKGLLKTSKRLLALDPQTIEDICLASSRELYDNASSGNYKFGDMLLAYEWWVYMKNQTIVDFIILRLWFCSLDVPAPTPRLIKEKEFIEATSRISSFNVTSRGGVPISPIEIRLTQDRLSLVSRVLSSNADAYKHTEVILELVYKLGYRGDIIAEVKTLAMIADTALQAEDFSRAYEICERMVTIVRDMTSATPGSIDPTVQQIKEVCWVSCFQLGRQTEYADLDKKLLLLGHALELCPSDRLHDALNAWRRLENDDVTQRRERIARGLETRASQRPKSQHPLSASAVAASTASSIAARFQDLHIPSPQLLNTPDAAAMANRAFSRVAANFNFARGRSLVSEDEGERSRSGSRPRIDTHEVSAQANRVLQRGIGWLLGGDE